MSRILGSLLIGGAIGYRFGSRPEQTRQQVQAFTDRWVRLARTTLQRRRHRSSSPADDLVDDMSAASFPSSDPPSTWAGPDEMTTGLVPDNRHG